MMGIRLRILSWWTPEWLLKKGLDELASSTIQGLGDLLCENSSLKNENHHKQVILNGNLDEKRKLMARAHNKLVESLIENVGKDEAISQGRQVMFQKGLLLGQRFRKILGVGNHLNDLINAARILYSALGIDFQVEENKRGEITMVVNHCSLARDYNPPTCQILSAADEGVVQGLNPNIKMEFTQKITEGCSHCLASIKLDEKELTS
jgi:predicted ArsR family transcriptional regulator